MKGFVKDVEEYHCILNLEGIREDLTFKDVVDIPNTLLDKEFINSLYKLYVNRRSLSTDQENIINEMSKQFI